MPPFDDFTGTDLIILVKETGVRGESSSSARSDPQKSEEAVDHRQNNSYIKAVGTSPVRSNLCAPLVAVSTAVRSRVTRTMSVAHLLRNS